MRHASPYAHPMPVPVSANSSHFSLRRAAISAEASSRQTQSQSAPMSRVCLGNAVHSCSLAAVHMAPPTARACCEGTMFYGAATEAQTAHRLLNLAADRGVNVFDTAEMYPVPQSAQHQGQSEVVLGNWLKTQCRCDFSLFIYVAKAWLW